MIVRCQQPSVLQFPVFERKILKSAINSGLLYLSPLLSSPTHFAWIKFITSSVFLKDLLTLQHSAHFHLSQFLTHLHFLTLTSKTHLTFSKASSPKSSLPQQYLQDAYQVDSWGRPDSKSPLLLTLPQTPLSESKTKSLHQLLLKILETSQVSVDVKTIAASWRKHSIPRTR